MGGRGVQLGVASGVYERELFLCIDVDDAAKEANVRQASGIDHAWLPAELIEEREELFFNPTRKQVEARSRQYWGDLMLSEQTAPVTGAEQCRDLLFTEARKQLHSVLPGEKSAFHSRLARIACLRVWAPELELPVSDDEFLAGLLYDLCPHKRSFAELCAAPWLEWLNSRLTPAQNLAVDRECPDKIEVPSGRQIQLDYTAGKPPVLAVRIQEVFSWTDTPRIAFGRVPILLYLLAPNFRPQQVPVPAATQQPGIRSHLVELASLQRSLKVFQPGSNLIFDLRRAMTSLIICSMPASQSAAVRGHR